MVRDKNFASDVKSHVEERLCTRRLSEGQPGQICSGDSGGPLMYYNKSTDQYFAIGVASALYKVPKGGSPCKEVDNLSLFTKISQNYEFLISEDPSICFKDFRQSK